MPVTKPKPLAQALNVPYGCLQSHLQGHRSHKARKRATRLTDSQEAALIEWIRAQCAVGKSPTEAEILDAATGLMQQAPRNGKNTPLSKTWAVYFLAKRLPSDMVYGYPEPSYGIPSRAEAGFGASSASNSSVKDVDIEHSGETCQQSGPLRKRGNQVKVVSVIDPSLVSKPPRALNPRPLQRGKHPKNVSVIDTSPASNLSLVPHPSPASNPPPVKCEWQPKDISSIDTLPTSNHSSISNSLPISNPQASEPPKSATPMLPYTGQPYISPLDDTKIRPDQDWRLLRQRYRENREIVERARRDCDAMEEVLRTYKQLESPEPEDIKVDLAGLRV